MAIAASTFDDAPTERQPGQLLRSKQGTPYVADPDGALVKSGPRKGLAKMIAYGRPSGFGKAVEDGYNLAKWSERQVALGIGIDYADACAALMQSELATACAALAGLDRDSKEFREAADGVVTEAKRIAKSGLAAERGTHAHAIAEDDDEGRDWIVRAEAGELLDMDAAAQRRLVDAWRRMLAVNGIEILATEFIIVHDGYRMAGTADRLARLTRDLRFVLVTGEIVTLPAGTVVVLDIKSGKRRTDGRGVAMYWQSYAVQIATYAGGVLYDPDTDTRSPYPWDVDQRWGLIAHLDVLGAIAGEASCELILVDLEAGRHAADLCMAAKAWERRQDVFSTSQIVDADLPRQVADEPADAGVSDAPAPAVVLADAPMSVEKAAVGSSSPSPAAATPSPVEAHPPQRRRPLHDRLRRHPDIDEGTVDHPNGLEVAFAALRRRFEELEPTDSTWLSAIQADAAQQGCGFHARDAKTLRRFELIRGLVTLAVHGDSDDELVRVMVHHITGDDVALFPSIAVGHIIGSLDAAEAQRFAQLADALVAGSMGLTFTDDGKPLLRALVAS